MTQIIENKKVYLKEIWEMLKKLNLYLAIEEILPLVENSFYKCSMI